MFTSLPRLAYRLRLGVHLQKQSIYLTRMASILAVPVELRDVAETQRRNSCTGKLRLGPRSLAENAAPPRKFPSQIGAAPRVAPARMRLAI
jgi:hypothetical protein